MMIISTMNGMIVVSMMPYSTPFCAVTRATSARAIMPIPTL